MANRAESTRSVRDCVAIHHLDGFLRAPIGRPLPYPPELAFFLASKPMMSAPDTTLMVFGKGSGGAV